MYRNLTGGIVLRTTYYRQRRQTDIYGSRLTTTILYIYTHSHIYTFENRHQNKDSLFRNNIK